MTQKQISKGLAVVYLAVLALLPFHAFLTTWAGSNFGGLDIWRIWKELIIVATVPLVAYLAWKDKNTCNWLKRSWLPRLIGLYVVVHLLWGAVAFAAGNVNFEALVYGLLANLRMVGFFLLVTVISMRSDLLRRYATKIVFIAGAIVVAFGLLQVFALPYDFLKHFGYGPNTIPAFQTVDNKLDYQRIQSTLRGANPLGAYLVVLIGLVLAEWRSRARLRGNFRRSEQPFFAKASFNLFNVASATFLKSKQPLTKKASAQNNISYPKDGLQKRSLKLVGFDIALVGALFFTYSRSAYIGALATVAVVLWLTIQNVAAKRYLLAGAAIIATVGLVGIFALRDEGVIQNTVFHSDETSSSVESSNAGRARALEAGVRDVATQPFGQGPGTAGPASARNDGGGRIAENYYLQIGQETGWLGLGLFVAIVVMVGKMLWQRRDNWMALGLFASLIGLSVVNLVSHAWADDTLGLLWWGLVGITLGSAILKQNETTQKRKARS